MEKQSDLRERTKRFAADAIRFTTEIPATEAGFVIRKQFIRRATSVGANYRAAQLARSKAEFVAKLQVTLEEADECVY